MKNKFISWNDPQNKFGLSNEEFFRYMQLKGFDFHSFGQRRNLEEIIFGSQQIINQQVKFTESCRNHIL